MTPIGASTIRSRESAVEPVAERLVLDMRVSLVVATASMLVTILVIAVVLWRLGVLFAPTE